MLTELTKIIINDLEFKKQGNGDFKGNGGTIFLDYDKDWLCDLLKNHTSYLLDGSKTLVIEVAKWLYL